MVFEPFGCTTATCTTNSPSGTFCCVLAYLFCKKLHINPAIFDCIVNKIYEHEIFHSGSNNLQLPVSIQLAIFLNCAGHYGNAISPEDMAQ